MQHSDDTNPHYVTNPHQTPIAPEQLNPVGGLLDGLVSGPVPPPWHTPAPSAPGLELNPNAAPFRMNHDFANDPRPPGQAPFPVPEPDAVDALSRLDAVDRTLRDSASQPTVPLQVESGAVDSLPLLAAFQGLEEYRRHRETLRATVPVTDFPQAPAWEQLGTAIQTPAPAGMAPIPPAEAQQLPYDYSQFASSMLTHQITNLENHRNERAENQQAAAHSLAERYVVAHDQGHPYPVIEESDEVDCLICSDSYLDGELVSKLECGHSFHSVCIDTWCAHCAQGGSPLTCPLCRAEVQITDAAPYDPNATVVRPHLDSVDFQSVVSASSGGSVFPWWPTSEVAAISQTYHANTQLSSGRLSFIVDPGAWTNLVGKLLARKLAARALEAGLKPCQNPMQQLKIAGVGHGSQECNFTLTCPIALTQTTGKTGLHKITAPIVEGAGEELPGLLGLRTLEAERAIMDTGNRKLYFPGPGEIQIILPPGSVEIPLHKAPSGHLVMIVDDYEKLTNKAGGLAEHSLSLHTAASSSTDPLQCRRCGDPESNASSCQRPGCLEVLAPCALEENKGAHVGANQGQDCACISCADRLDLPLPESHFAKVAPERHFDI